MHISRMYLQLRNNGLLFLILPLRCIDNKLVGQSHFQRLLECIGFELALPIRITPKLIFYTLRKKVSLAIEIKNKDNDFRINNGNNTKINKSNMIETNRKNEENSKNNDSCEQIPSTLQHQISDSLSTHWKIEASKIIAQLPDDIKNHFSAVRLCDMIKKKRQNEFTIIIVDNASLW